MNQSIGLVQKSWKRTALLSHHLVLLSLAGLHFFSPTKIGSLPKLLLYRYGALIPPEIK